MTKMLHQLLSKTRYHKNVNSAICISICFLTIASSTAFGRREATGATIPYPEELVIPFYPGQAQLAEVQGTVECKAYVVDGRINVVDIVSGSPFFKNTVIDAVKKWLYGPGITQTIQLKFVFHLIDDKSITIYPAKLHLPNEIHLYAPRMKREMY
jgi:hypothetical protein